MSSRLLTQNGKLLRNFLTLCRLVLRKAGRQRHTNSLKELFQVVLGTSQVLELLVVGLVRQSLNIRDALLDVLQALRKAKPGRLQFLELLVGELPRLRVQNRRAAVCSRSRLLTAEQRQSFDRGLLESADT